MKNSHKVALHARTMHSEGTVLVDALAILQLAKDITLSVMACAMGS